MSVARLAIILGEVCSNWAAVSWCCTSKAGVRNKGQSDPSEEREGGFEGNTAETYRDKVRIWRAAAGSHRWGDLSPSASEVQLGRHCIRPADWALAS